MSEHTEQAANTIRAKAVADAGRFIDVGGEQISLDSIRARFSVERQRDIDARFAAAFSTESELADYDLESVRELGKHAR